MDVSGKLDTPRDTARDASRAANRGHAPPADEERLSSVISRAPDGLAAPLVRVEVHLGSGLPMFALVGLPEAVVRESKERVRSAIVTAGFDFPPGRITVNLSPADLPKEGGRFDLPIAIGILAAGGVVKAAALEQREFYGELALGGELRETRKLLPALLHGIRSGHELIMPAANASEAILIGSSRLKLARTLKEAVAALQGKAVLASADGRNIGNASASASGEGDGFDHCGAVRPTPPDIADVRGQYYGKRALEIAAAGEHGLLMLGPPGAGKTLLAQRLPSLLPALTDDEILEVAALESAAGRRPSLGGRRPFRSPQHTASVAALIGGSALRPGELSMAHLGVLFLDEFPEFARNVLEALREPMESGVVKLTRLKRSFEFPARFQLIAAMNPCPCGYAGDTHGRCHCTAAEIRRYRGRISGPLLDRIDIHIELQALPVEHLMRESPSEAETSATVSMRVAAARRLQMHRQGKLNARLTAKETTKHCRLERRSRALLAAAISRLGLSARAYHRVLKVARTCADLAAEREIRLNDVAEAVKLRGLDQATPL